MNLAVLVVFMALIAQALCACSGLPSAARSSAPYANLYDPPPRRDLGADQEVARAKADLSAARDTAQQQAFHWAMLGSGLRSRAAACESCCGHPALMQCLRPPLVGLPPLYPYGRPS
jgi:hypothetical protein